jgi:hypothetical protein
MRKMELKIAEAFREGRATKISNTEVRVTADGSVIMLLHGNVIAVKENGKTSVTFSGWVTRTTCSRLRAIGVMASIERGLPYINGRAVTSTEIVSV